MAGPSPQFLADIYAPFAAGAQLAGVGPTPAGPAMSVAGAPPGLPPVFGLPGGAPIMAPQDMPPAGPPPPPAGPPDPHMDEQRGMSVMGPTSSQGPAPPPPPQHGPMVGGGGNAYPLVATGGGGMSKARELERRGPSLLAAQGLRNQASEDTITRVGDRNQDMAQQEYAQALEQERAARARESAQQQSFAERDEELAQRQADFDTTSKQLSKMGQIDPDRWWASRSTGQKIAGFLELALSGFAGAPSMVKKRIDDDIKAQEFAYYATRDTAQAKQTAFSLAMQKYQNADAARSMARVSALDVVQTQLGQMGAKWKGTEAANRADMAAAALQDEKMMQIANGIQFLPSQYVGRKFLDPRTGLLYSEAEAKAMSAKVDERDFENRKQTAGIGGQLMVEGAKGEVDLTKAQMALAGKADEGAGKIANMLQQAGVPQARDAAEQALQALSKSPGGAGEAVARGAIGTVPVVGGGLANKVMSDDANAREQAYQNYANQAMKAMMGNVTAGEEARAAKMLGSASDPESRRRAIYATMKTLEAIEKNAKAGESTAAQAQFEQRRENAKGDRPAAPPSANKGW